MGEVPLYSLDSGSREERRDLLAQPGDCPQVDKHAQVDSWRTPTS